MTRSSLAYKRILPPKSMKPEDTVSLAVSDDEKRKALQHVHIENGYAVAADGFRLHAQKTRARTCPICKKNGYHFPEWQNIVPLKSKYSAVIDSRQPRAVAVRMEVFARESYHHVTRLSVNGKVQCRAVSEELGESNEEMPVVTSSGPEVTFGLNARFLIDALDHVAPEGGPVELRANGPSQPVLLRGKDRIAVLMPVHLG